MMPSALEPWSPGTREAHQRSPRDSCYHSSGRSSFCPAQPGPPSSPLGAVTPGSSEESHEAACPKSQGTPPPTSTHSEPELKPFLKVTLTLKKISVQKNW